MLSPGVLFQSRTAQKGADRNMGYIIAFIAGTMAGVTLMCIVSVTTKDPQEDDEQMEYLKEWNNKHGNREEIE